MSGAYQGLYPELVRSHSRQRHHLSQAGPSSSSVVRQMLQGLCASTRQLRLAPFLVAKEEGKMNKDDDMPGLEAFMRDALEEAHASGLPPDRGCS